MSTTLYPIYQILCSHHRFVLDTTFMLSSTTINLECPFFNASETISRKRQYEVTAFQAEDRIASRKKWEALCIMGYEETRISLRAIRMRRSIAINWKHWTNLSRGNAHYYLIRKRNAVTRYDTISRKCVPLTFPSKYSDLARIFQFIAIFFRKRNRVCNVMIHRG